MSAKFSTFLLTLYENFSYHNLPPINNALRFGQVVDRTLCYSRAPVARKSPPISLKQVTQKIDLELVCQLGLFGDSDYLGNL
jgi:hypothetical protein